MESAAWLLGGVVLWLFSFGAVAVTVWAAWEAARFRAWGWLLSIVLLQPVGTIAWFVTGRRLYLQSESTTD